jgi:hypothetical protein
MKFAKIYSPFGMIIVEGIKKLPKNLLLAEVRPWFNPHPSERLTKQFQSLLMSQDEEKASEALISIEELPPALPPPQVTAIRTALERVEPDSYAGNAYGQLIDSGLLPQGGTWGLVRGVAQCTPDDIISNRTRWALQMLLVRYWMKFGRPALSDSFLYAWHDCAFQFAGHSRTIGKLAWMLMQATPKVMSEKYAVQVGCTAIYLTNQPDGTIPALTVVPRMAIDTFSRLLYE